MRVTASTFPDSLLSQLNRLAIRQARLQQQAASGQRLTRPEDDPVAMRRVLDMQAEAGSIAQYQRNVDRHKELAGASYASIKALKTVVDRASEIVTLADDLKSPEELQTYATEINQLIQQAAQVMNAQNRGDYLFGGTRVGVEPFAVTHDTDGQVTAVTYQGNAETPESEIAPGITVSSHTVGVNTSGSGPRGLVADSRSGADLFAHLISLRDNLRAGNTAAVASVDRENLEKDAEAVIYQVGTNGAVQTRLETATALLKQRAANLESLVSKEADADLADTLVRLNEVQTAYQAALQSGGTILNRSLMDYLR